MAEETTPSGTATGTGGFWSSITSIKSPIDYKKGGHTQKTPRPKWTLLLLAVFACVVAGLGINLYNSATGFSNPGSASGIQVFDIIVLVVFILVFIYALAPPFVYLASKGTIVI